MLNRNAFIDDVIKLFLDKKILPQDELSNLLKLFYQNPHQAKWGVSYSVTEFCLRALYQHSPADMGGLSEEEIETLLKKHDYIVSHVCAANYAALQQFCNHPQPNKELEDEGANGLNYVEMLKIPDAIIPDLVESLKSIECSHVEFHFANYLYQRSLRQPDFDLYKLTITLYQAVPTSDPAYSLVQQRIAELIFAELLKSNEVREENKSRFFQAVKRVTKVDPDIYKAARSRYF